MRSGHSQSRDKSPALNKVLFTSVSASKLRMKPLRYVTILAGGFLATIFASPLQAQPPSTETFRVTIHVDAARTEGELRPAWRFFGADEPNFAYMKDGKKLIAELGQLRPRAVYFRTHNLLTSGNGTPAMKWGSSNAYTEDAQGHPVYDWTIVDCIFDTYLQRGVRPYVQIGL